MNKDILVNFHREQSRSNPLGWNCFSRWRSNDELVLLFTRGLFSIHIYHLYVANLSLICHRYLLHFINNIYQLYVAKLWLIWHRHLSHFIYNVCHWYAVKLLYIVIDICYISSVLFIIYLALYYHLSVTYIFKIVIQHLSLLIWGWIIAYISLLLFYFINEI